MSNDHLAPSSSAVPPLEAGAYELIRNRLQQQAGDLRTRLEQLNRARREIFGGVETKLIATDRINTDNYCRARDVVAVGERCLFGYNVHIGLRSGIALRDVFSVYAFREQRFHEEDLSLLEDDRFRVDFQNLYRYYKEAYFARFVRQSNFLYMIFHLKAGSDDFKAFKWLLVDGRLEYIDNRSDHEVQRPAQYDFQWKHAGRDDHRRGRFPHVSILDRVFVETVGGDLTIKVEDNTDDGRGIYREAVEHRDQTLDDAEYQYADLGNLIALKVRPYQEGDRYFVYNEKLKEAQRIDTLADSGVLLPDGHGLIFANGYYLQTGEYKLFEGDFRGMQFRSRLASPNGEDYLYVFGNDRSGSCVLLHYNLISQRVNTPIGCHGFTVFPGGELCYFKSEEEPTKHHVMQIWQTPFTAGESLPSEHTDAYLFKVGNRDIVRAMAECQEILTLARKEDDYDDLYDDLARRCTEVLDAYYWIGQEAAFRLDEPLRQLRETANAAIDEFEKKRRVERETAAEQQRVQHRADGLFDQIRRQRFDSVERFVHALSELRVLRGEIAGLRDLRYSDPDRIAALEGEAAERGEALAEGCIRFLLQEEALAPYSVRIDELEGKLENVDTARAGAELETHIDETGAGLELLIEVVGNLRIDDATQTTAIIDRISALYARLNQVRAALRRRIRALRRGEAVAEFNAQLKLLEQTIVNYLDLADAPDKCDDYLTRLMVQLEELEGKFAEIDEFIGQLAEKREEVYSAFEARKNELVEARNNRAAALQQAGERILDGIRKRAGALAEAQAINSFFASDLLVDKVRDLVRQLEALDDANKAAQLQTRLKTLREEALRQLRDRRELFEEGARIIRLGRHRFPVNVQPLELTTVRQGDSLQFHLTGTQYYRPVTDAALLAARDLWDQPLISENERIYRAEYLAYELYLERAGQYPAADAQQLDKVVEKAAAGRYREGYSKGVHDHDAAAILSALLDLSGRLGLLRYSPRVRAAARLFWTTFLEERRRGVLEHQLKSAGTILRVFPGTREFDYLLDELAAGWTDFSAATGLFPPTPARAVADYLFREISEHDTFIAAAEAINLKNGFQQFLRSKKAVTAYRDSIGGLPEQAAGRYRLLRTWVQAYLEQEAPADLAFLDEITVLLLLDDEGTTRVHEVPTRRELDGLRGDHPVLQDGRYTLDYHHFTDKLERYRQETTPRYRAYRDRKRQRTEEERRRLRLDEFRPRVLSSFVRNRLIDQVYLPLFGDNLAKQLGTAGEATRTDRMGLLLLLSPPGYGKTTLMEYLANQLGLVFVKINGPALGHRVHSLAPEDAPTLAARRELERLNLSLEMGDNVMLYVDDIQHCHPEFLQKFISLCDAQRKIEGVYDGEPRTYDLRGRRFCVVMAGNPYTESGEKFRIPDMLANRADIYNLGDIIGDRGEAFRLSYLENALTANPTLRRLAAKSMADVYALVQALETDTQDPPTLEGNHGPEELNEYRSVLARLLRVRDVILRVNQAYIRSAAMEDDYRSAPPFRLQGSYRDMNKLAEKIVPVMNDEELDALLRAHYENEAQTLTAGAEANLLQLKELLGWLTETEAARWADIQQTYRQNKTLRGLQADDAMAQVVAGLSGFREGLEGIREAIEGGRAE